MSARARFTWVGLLLSLAATADVRAQWPSGGQAVSPIPSGSQTVGGIVADGAGGAVVTWWAYVEGVSTIRAQRIDATGTPQWTADGVVLAAPADYQSSALLTVSDGTGGAISIWRDYSETLSVQRVTGGGVVAWPDPVTFAGGSWDFDAATVAAGEVVVVWATNPGFLGGPIDIRAAHVDASGAPDWGGDGIPVCTAIGAQELPKVIADGAGGAIIVWEDERSGASRDVYAQRVTRAGIPIWGSQGLPVCTAPHAQDEVRICPDGAGGAFVAWTDDRAGGVLAAVGHDLYVQRLSASGVSLWTANGVAVCTADFEQRADALVPDGSGGVTVVWEDERGSTSDEFEDLYAQRIDGAGAPVWNAGGVLVCQAPYDQRDAVAVADGAGGILTAWVDSRNGYGYYTDYEDIYAQRLSVAGGPAWPAEELAVCTAPFGQRDVRAASDGAGGMYLAWDDYRDSSDGIYNDGARVYVHRIPLAGPPTDAGEPVVGPRALAALQNTPNPFSRATDLRFVAPGPGEARILVTDVAGRVVHERLLGVDAGGLRSVRFDPERPLPSGVYYFRVTLGGASSGRSIVVRR